MIEANLISKEVPMKYRLHENIRNIQYIVGEKRGRERARESISNQVKGEARREMK
jgi:hypothetical protein